MVSNDRDCIMMMMMMMMIGRHFKLSLTSATFLICHLLRLSPVTTMPSSIKNKGYLTREDADISSDLFFAEVVKGKLINRPVLTHMFWGGRIKNGTWPSLARVAESRNCRLVS